VRRPLTGEQPVTAGDGLRRGDEAVSTEHVSVGLLSLATLILIGMLAVATAATAATATDLWQRRVPRWLTRGGICAGVVVAASGGSGALVASLLGVACGALFLL
jgi:hypothetical protein